jgi:hypothetical protein
LILNLTNPSSTPAPIPPITNHQIAGTTIDIITPSITIVSPPIPSMPVPVRLTVFLL